MSWNDCLYQYYKEHVGQYLGGREDSALLILTWRGRPMVVDLLGEYGRRTPTHHVRARVAVGLAKPYELTIGARRLLSAKTSAILRAAPADAGDAAELGYPEVTRKRLIHTNNKPFTRQALGSGEFRSALLSCPEDKVEIRPGPGEDGVHLITVITEARTGSDDSGWDLGAGDRYTRLYGSEEEKAKRQQQLQAAFSPRMDRFLNLIRAAYNAVTQQPM